MRARRTALLCAAAVSVAFSRQAIGQEQPQTQQPPLPPVTVQPPPHRPTPTAAKPSTAGQRAKPRRTRRVVRRPAPTNGAAAQQAAAEQAAAQVYQTREGSEAQGYKPSTVTNFGPFGQVPILNVPYSVNVISSELLQNIQAASPNDAFRISPVTQLQSTYT
jgi:outer membrane receptor for monomeric catechols